MRRDHGLAFDLAVPDAEDQAGLVHHLRRLGQRQLGLAGELQDLSKNRNFNRFIIPTIPLFFFLYFYEYLEKKFMGSLVPTFNLLLLLSDYKLNRYFVQKRR